MSSWEQERLYGNERHGMDYMRRMLSAAGHRDNKYRKYFIVEVDEEREKIAMKCPNCRCQIHVSSRVCPYCGLIITGSPTERKQEYDRVSGAMGYQSYPDYRRSGSMRSNTTNTFYQAERNRMPQRKKQNRDPFYQELTILLLSVLVVLELLQIVILLVK